MTVCRECGEDRVPDFVTERDICRRCSAPVVLPPPRRVCVIDGCDADIHGVGLCKRHYSRSRRLMARAAQWADD